MATDRKIADNTNVSDNKTPIVRGKPHSLTLRTSHFRYRDLDGNVSDRHVLITELATNADGQYYFRGLDYDRQEYRSFLVNGLVEVTPTVVQVLTVSLLEEKDANI